MGIRICPKCGGKVSSSRNLCIHCGYTFPNSIICPDCGEAVNPNVKECPCCGYFFNKKNSFADVLTTEIKQEEIYKDINNDITIAVPELPETEKCEESEEIISESVVPVSYDIDANIEEANDDISVSLNKCPYCASEDLMLIGNNYYLCTTCKMKFFLNDESEARDVDSADNSVSPIVPLSESNSEEQICESDNNSIPNEKSFGEETQITTQEEIDKPLKKNKKRRKNLLTFLIILVSFLDVVFILYVCFEKKCEKYLYFQENDSGYSVSGVKNKDIEKLVIPRFYKFKPVTSINGFVFRDCRQLTTITIPNSVTTIGAGAFSGCIKLTTITIPNSVTSIGACAFYGCSNLNTIYCEASKAPIGWNSFWNYNSKATIIWDCKCKS